MNSDFTYNEAMMTGSPISGGEGFRSGFVTVVGKPNVGKSTLINSLVGRKVAIVSSKPQTTRHRILGVKNGQGVQAVFVDTPGVHKPSHELGRYLEKTYLGELQGADMVLLMVDSTHDMGEEDDRAFSFIFKGNQPVEVPVILVVNKIDAAKPGKVEKIEEQAMSRGKFTGVFRVSALKGTGLESLENAVMGALPEGPPYFPPDQVSDQTPELQAAEMVREKILLKTRQEIPHCVFVHTEDFREGKTPGVLYISVYIYVEKKSQKGIIIGKGGKRLKDIGALARMELETLLGKKVFLDLWVKVKEDWRDRKDLLKSWGYEL